MIKRNIIILILLIFLLFGGLSASTLTKIDPIDDEKHELLLRIELLEVALLVENYIDAHPGTIEDLREDESFQKIIFEMKDISAYGAIADPETKYIILHPNKNLLDKDLSYLKDTAPQWWDLFQRSLEEETCGHYWWPEENGELNYKVLCTKEIEIDNKKYFLAATGGHDDLEYHGKEKIDFAEESIKQKAKDVAKQIEIYLGAHPEKTIKDLQEDLYFQSIAVQKVGETGYTAVTDYDTLIARFHKNPDVVDLDLSTLSEKLPGFWKIMEKTRGGIEAEGIYDWQEADGSINKKYMYIALVNSTTAEGVGLHVAATTYLDEYLLVDEKKDIPLWFFLIFSAIVLIIILMIFINYRKNKNLQEEKMKVEKTSIKKKIFISYLLISLAILALIIFLYLRIDSIGKANFFVIFAFSIFLIVFLIIFGINMSSSITKSLRKLYWASREIEKGNLNSKVNIKTGDELESLGNSFNKTLEVLRKTEEEHKQLDKSKTEFLSITSHELRSPMTPMQAQLEMLLKGYYGELNEKQKQSLDIVNRNTKRLDNIIVDFLEISRIEAARLKFRFSKADLTPNIKRLIKEMDGFLPEKKIKLKLKMTKLPVIEADSDRTMQILRNLINNAKKFSKENTTITITVQLRKNDILFSVQDQGIGISEKDKVRIFEPFFQAEQTMYREHQGTGLGLAIVRGIVEAQKGKIWIESRVGEGTTFFFTLPLIPTKIIKPIKLLFSSQKEINKKIKGLFLEFLGPLGIQEYTNLEEVHKLSKEELTAYLDELVKKGIILLKKAQTFKEKIIQLYQEAEGKDSKIDSSNLQKRGLIKK